MGTSNEKKTELETKLDDVIKKTNNQNKILLKILTQLNEQPDNTAEKTIPDKNK